ncbi:hypothetical protein AB4440_07170 [Vibrio splendidus]|uniref:hypothetical protein n=1 Tax=Vibrio splendidus TaxID=29497 RepID=UPI000C844341|nr:hypothetical protein [Vibrio splendidus]PMO97113.1 hypothetical protein BCS97_10500 [Vibrio splendidus]PMP27096.1 hypothetical protein BCS89_10795 [Vibrio splendidus]PMP36013.1 hypothetical protein BCS88_07270 [Vibrio splendidus]PMP47458.1 hypothetical protein BCS87_00435 [Vibrio splendidus]PMP48988.1 hypothetical protein BCS85_08485 [Vibrio splendidus]
MKYNLFIILIYFSLSSSPLHAKRYWPVTILSDWTLTLNNGVAYISSPQFADHCSYRRGQINMGGTEFDKAQYSYALSAKARGKKLEYVVDDTDIDCIISGLSEFD